MSVNGYLPHLLVIPEDDKNREIANGFVLDSRVKTVRIQVLPPAGGWLKVIEKFVGDHVGSMQRFPERRVLLLIDFDDEVVARTAHVQGCIPPTLAGRVFLLGVKSEPEKLTAACKKKTESIGEALAAECASNQAVLWAHPLLAHNAAELARLKAQVNPFLF
jgi:hypothetical protein